MNWKKSLKKKTKKFDRDQDNYHHVSGVKGHKTRRHYILSEKEKLAKEEIRDLNDKRTF